FQQLWDFAIRLIKEGKAYVDEQTSEEIAAQKGTPTQAGTESPYRNRPIEENLDLFMQMTRGEIEEGRMVLRAKIDMASSNMHFRDPIIYRVVNHPHHRTGDKWKVYPMYDFAHGQSDYFEGVTHSLCTLEFVPHRPLYDLFVDWVKEGVDPSDERPRQYEFNKLNLNYTLMSKRNLLILVKEGLVNGWDDPRMPTLCGFRRRGYSPESIRNFVDKIGYTTYDALNDMALLESAVRDDLNKRATRVSAVIDPVKLVITNYPEGQVESFEAINNPEDPESATHTIEFSRELWMEREDFMEDAPKNYFRMTPGKEVRLKNAYIVKCTGCDKDENGNITTVYAEYDPETKTGMPGSNRKVKGTLHWVSCDHCIKAEVRLYDRLWKVENPRDEMSAIRKEQGCEALEAMKQMINEDSLKVLTECYVEKYLADAKPYDYLQFQRIGYFNVDKESTPDHLIFNRTVTLKDTWAKLNK
ncbi:MAG: glutamine--tRNA ligase, partial [Alistipes sp.]|nr:glutamine--tRNA ligase [Alistipes sp.]